VYGRADSPALILIPGMTCGPWEWGNEIRRFAGSHRIYAITLPGFDGAPPINAPLFDTVSADFWALLQRQNIQKPTVIGHSIGGTLAILLGEQHPDRLRAVIAIDGLPTFPGTESMSAAQRNATAARTSAAVASLSQNQFAVSQKQSLPYMVTAASDADAIARRAGLANPAATAQWMAEDVALDLRPALKNVTIPLIEIAPFDPTLDPFGPSHIPDATAKRRYYASFFAAAPRAEVRVIAPSRHFIMYDDAAALDEAIAQIL
jgi:pimeloyl-ACP methyl ester carboxylesterase